MKRRDGSWTNGGSKGGEKEQRGRESATGQSRKEWSISKVLARGREGGIVGSGGGGLLCFLQSCLSMLPGEPFFPIYQGVRCGMQMASVAACMYSEWLRDLEGHHLMSSLLSANMTVKDAGRVISHNQLDMC